LNESEEQVAMQMGLSEQVQASLDEAVKMIDSLVDELLATALEDISLSG
jgi:hypothetical protein